MSVVRAVQSYLAWDSNFTIAIPNYTPSGWYECDLFAVTRAGYFYEFEIKQSRTDFFADARKGMEHRFQEDDGGHWKDLGPENKHDRIASKDSAGPARFIYVTPKDMIKPEEIPAWAGWMEFALCDNGQAFARTRKDAPKLHGVKIEQSIVDHAFSVCYHRFWKERRRVDSLLRRKQTKESP